MMEEFDQEVSVSDVETWVEKRTILKLYRGSRAYGTNTPSSDIDLGGVCLPPKELVMGMQRFEQYQNKKYPFKDTVADYVNYGLPKYIRLAYNCNPNIIEMMFSHRNSYIFTNDFGKRLMDMRYEFLTTRARHTFGGYAYSQLQRMTGENKSKHGSHYEYIEKYGYDTKNAMHLFRLLKMGLEILMDGEVNVLRPDNNWLVDVKNGLYTLEQCQKEAERLFSLLDEAYVRSKLPRSPNFKKINDFLIEMTEESMKWEGNP